MAKCQVKTGFLVLRDCENDALDTCTICGCNVCMKHKREHPQNHQICCIDCYAKSLEEAEGGNQLDTDENHCCKCGKEVVVKAGKNNPQNKVIDPENNRVYCQDCYDHITGDTSMLGLGLLSTDYYDDDYWYGYRHNYYRNHHYKPLSRGSHRYGAFKEDEVRAFDPKNNPQEKGMIDDSSDKDNVFDS